MRGAFIPLLAACPTGRLMHMNEDGAVVFRESREKMVSAVEDIYDEGARTVRLSEVAAG